MECTRVYRPWPGGGLGVAWWWPDGGLAVAWWWPGDGLVVAWWWPGSGLVVAWRWPAGLAGDAWGPPGAESDRFMTSDVAYVGTLHAHPHTHSGHIPICIL